MDRENERLLKALARDEQERSKVRLLREFDPASVATGDLEVPDPYYGAAGGFEEVLDLVQAACEGLLGGDPQRRADVSLPAGARVLGGVGGGDINQAFHVVLADGREAFVKTRPDAAAGRVSRAEAAGLRWLGEPGALRVPEVLEVGEDYLAIEWIPRGGLGRDRRGGARPGPGGDPRRGLAGVRAGVRRAGDAARTPARFGSLGLPNEPTADWATFYAERRLRPLARRAAETGALSSSGVEAVEEVCERMAGLVGPPEPPARLHGDLWAGNVMGDADGRPWLIDPSAFGGHREVDLAMLRLFGGPSERMFDAYREAHPLAEGWRDRVELYQLSPLLVHALLFGGSYRQAAERVAFHYGGTLSRRHARSAAASERATCARVRTSPAGGCI